MRQCVKSSRKTATADLAHVVAVKGFDDIERGPELSAVPGLLFSVE
jgi:hypothetical protein